MESIQTNKTTAKDFFLNLGAIVALYTVVFNILNLVFTVIDKAYPAIVNGYDYSTSYSISFPVATLIIFFPIFIFFMWFMNKGFVASPEKKNIGVRKWLTYITLFFAGLTLAIDLVWVLYRFIDGQDVTAGFLLKALSVLVMAGLVFYYYISDIRRDLTSHEKKSWVVLSTVIVLAVISWGFFVLGSPRTQQLLKYDEQKVSDLQNINQQIQDFYGTTGSLPTTLTDAYVSFSNDTDLPIIPVDEQTGKSYEYTKTGNTTYQLCAVFNKASDNTNPAGLYSDNYQNMNWSHPAGQYCFSESVQLPTKAPVAYPVAE